MRKLILLLYLASIIIVQAQVKPIITPPTHGANLKTECAVCHITDNWTTIKTDKFDHNKTKYPLKGQHTLAGCMDCHKSLDFSQTKSDCVGCHKDVHQGTVGVDCERCHNESSWIVNNVKTMHIESGFPLVGTHLSADCQRCHRSASKLRYNNIPTDCYSCHKEKYYAPKNLNHITAGFGTDCTECHTMTGRAWKSVSKSFHVYFPLTAAHDIACEYCHEGNNYKRKLSSDCLSCHYGLGTISDKSKVANSKDPLHKSVYSKDCSICHNSRTFVIVK